MYHFMILDSADLNAFALPGGYVYIFSGLFNRLNETEIAGVLAHEIAHVTAKHAVKRMQTALGYPVLLGLAAVSFGQKNPEILQQISGVSGVVFNLLSAGYGRQEEILADKLGVKYMILAGYAPQGMVRVLEILKEEKGPSGSVFEILSNHPRMEERIKKAKDALPQ